MKVLFYEDDSWLYKRFINPNTGEILSREAYYQIHNEERKRIGIRPINEWDRVLEWCLRQ